MPWGYSVQFKMAPASIVMSNSISYTQERPFNLLHSVNQPLIIVLNLRHFPSVALETVPVLIWLVMALSYPFISLKIIQLAALLLCTSLIQLFNTNDSVMLSASGTELVSQASQLLTSCETLVNHCFTPQSICFVHFLWLQHVRTVHPHESSVWTWMLKIDALLVWASIVPLPVPLFTLTLFHL